MQVCVHLTLSASECTCTCIYVSVFVCEREYLSMCVRAHVCVRACVCARGDQFVFSFQFSVLVLLEYL